MSAIFPSGVATPLQLLQAVNNTKVTLTVDAGIGDTTLTVDDASPLPSSGYVTFDDDESNPETIFYTGISGNNITGVTRAADNTAAGTHTAGANLEQRWNAAYHNMTTTEIIAVEQYLSDRFGIGSSPVVPSGKNLTLAATSNQLVLGTTNTTTISSTAPSGSRTYTIPDAGGAASFVMTAGTQTIAGAKTFSNAAIFSSTVEIDGALTLPLTTNQIVMGTTHTTTISSVAPSASRTYTIPDAGGAASFVMTAGTQTIAGATTFSATLTMSGATIAMGSQKITSLANGTAATDAMAFGQCHVFQIVAASTTTAMNTTSTSFQKSNLTATITPTSASSKILILATFCGGQDTSGDNVFYDVIRNTSTSVSGTSEGLFRIHATSANFFIPVAIACLDSPASTSATVYTVAVKVDAGTGEVGVSSAELEVITLIEVQ